MNTKRKVIIFSVFLVAWFVACRFALFPSSRPAKASTTPVPTFQIRIVNDRPVWRVGDKIIWEQTSTNPLEDNDAVIFTVIDWAGDIPGAFSRFHTDRQTIGNWGIQRCRSVQTLTTPGVFDWQIAMMMFAHDESGALIYREADTERGTITVIP